MLDLIVAMALLQAQVPAEVQAPVDVCNATRRASLPIPGCTTWEPVSANGEGFVDPASARRDGNHVEVMTRLLLSPPAENFYSYNIRVRLDCAVRTVLLVHATGFDAAGRRLAESNPTRPPTPVRPGTPYAGLLDRFCER